MTDQRAIPPFPGIETERLVVRNVRAEDAAALHARRNDPSTANWQSWAVPYPRERAQELVDQIVSANGVPPANDWFQLTVEERSTGRIVGDLALHLTFDGRCAELGYTFDAADRGSGYATEAAAALTRWCVEEVGVSRVSAQMHPDNIASARVAEHLGMVFEGHTRNSFWLDRADGTAENSDDLIYGMTAAMWQSWQERPRTKALDVQLIELNANNLLSVVDLATHHSQRQLVSSNAESIVDAYQLELREQSTRTAWRRAIQADGELAGFIMMGQPDDETSDAYLWRLMVDRMHQRRGIGSRAVADAIQQARDWGCPGITVSWVPGPGSPEPMYLAAGFVPTGDIEDGEVAARLRF